VLNALRLVGAEAFEDLGDSIESAGGSRGKPARQGIEKRGLGPRESVVRRGFSNGRRSRDAPLWCDFRVEARLPWSAGTDDNERKSRVHHGGPLDLGILEGVLVYGVPHFGHRDAH